MILTGKCEEVLKDFPDNSVDSIVTDPPYGLSFMGKKWDYQVPSVAQWAEILRVLKPGGHVLSFGGTRTYHRMVVNMEDAGFEIRDQVMWIYGSGFPKSMNVALAIDKQAGVKPTILGINPNSRPNSKMKGSKGFDGDLASEESAGEQVLTAATSDEAKQWQGWGTALKPANEPICVARKPLEKGLTVAANVLKWGTGAINVDASRIAGDVPSVTGQGFKTIKYGGNIGKGEPTLTGQPWSNPQGRWPANLLLDETAAEMLDQQSGILKSGAMLNVESDSLGFHGNGSGAKWNHSSSSGGASRFFYVAKASKRERNAGLEGMPEREGVRHLDGGEWSVNKTAKSGEQKRLPSANHHPTVKPIKLMEYLIKLITPPGGIVLDPFTGSGSTGVAALSLGFEFIGIEMTPEYAEIAEKRLEAVRVG